MTDEDSFVKFVQLFAKNLGVTQKKCTTAFRTTIQDFNMPTRTIMEETKPVGSQVCSYILTHGPKSGGVCGKNATKTFNNSNYCSTHLTTIKKRAGLLTPTKATIAPSTPSFTFKEKPALVKGLKEWVIQGTTLKIDPDRGVCVGKTDDSELTEDDKEQLKKYGCEIDINIEDEEVENIEDFSQVDI
jgi:hypothetical protein